MQRAEAAMVAPQGAFGRGGGASEGGHRVAAAGVAREEVAEEAERGAVRERGVTGTHPYVLTQGPRPGST